ncbi:MAG: transglycosylase SLT domain-containing protein [Deltaproteobacteria bacterium]|nr:transglycosylase SLT domain-containing protein [Deltaproteobacteria bacterium]
MKRKFTTLFFCLALIGSLPAAALAAGANDAAPRGALTAADMRFEAGCGGSNDAASELEGLEKDDCVNEDGGLAYSELIVDTASFEACELEAEDKMADGFSGADALLACVNPAPSAGPSIDGTGGIGEVASLSLSLSENDGMPEVPIVVNKSVESFINYFQTRGRKYFERWWGRSEDYMTMLQSILREEGLPEELSYIAFIESGLNPRARSKANAVGMWQFIRGTALRYGLRVDWWIDERMDPEKATYAAAKYFKNLYGQFGSWYLAAAGYNAGEGKVARAVRKHNTEDFWELASHKRPFRRETKEYVPKYLAALLIAKDPVSYGFEPASYNDAVLYEKVRISQATDLRVIADAAGTTVDEIQRLNPELLRWFTPPNYPDYEIKVPTGTAQTLVENMEKLPPSRRIAFQMHKVRRGETFAKIARKYGTSVGPILYINNMKSAKYLKPGTVIAVPVRADGVAGSKGTKKDVAFVYMHEDFQS